MHIFTASDLLQVSLMTKKFLSIVGMSDEMWLYGFDPETKEKSSQWKSPS
jgi:hypothetical protein